METGEAASRRGHELTLSGLAAAQRPNRDVGPPAATTMPLSTPDLILLNELLAQALDLAPEDRAAWLESLPAEVAGLRETLQQLLAKADAPETSDLLRPLSLFERRRAGADHEAGGRVGPYTLLRSLGEGGMGTVWLAERSDRALKRQVALKLPLIAAHPLMRQRLVRERDIVAGLVHPNIARLYDAGVDPSGQPYLALEYVDGQPIDDYCNQHAPDIRACLHLFLRVSQAVAYAHANLVLHRDLKPPNILVTADGQVRLLDFGIAKLLEEGAAHESDLTRLAGQALTPDYASPEQIAGQPLSVASDVYALGVVLYELLTGERPYRIKRGSRRALEDAILTVDVPAPSTRVANPARRRQIAGDLDTIVLKALKKAPEDRYSSVSAFADDLERYLGGRPVLARPDSAAYRVRKFVLRNRLAVGLSAAVLAALIGGAGVVAWEAKVARLEARKSQAVQAFLTDVFLTNTHDQADPRKAQATTARELLTIGTHKIESSMDDAPAAKAEVLRTLGELLAEFGLSDEAVNLQRRRVALLRTLYGARDPRLAEALLKLDAAMETSSKFGQRAPILQEAQSILDASPGADPALQGELHLQWAGYLQNVDRMAGAEHARRAAAIFAALHLDAKRMAALLIEGNVALRTGDPAAAERSYAESLRIGRSLPGAPARDLPIALMYLGRSQTELMKPAEAEHSFRDAVDTAERIFGKDNQTYVETIINYGSFLAQSARFKEALPWLREAIEAQRRTKGDNETYVLPKALIILGLVLVDYGRAEEGAPLVERAVELRRGPNPAPALAGFLQSAARAQIEAGNLARAKTLLDEAATISDGLKPDAARERRGDNDCERAHWALRAEQPQQALTLLRGGCAGGDAPPANKNAVRGKIFVAEAHLQAGDIDAAARLSQEARAVIERLHLGPAAGTMSARLDIIDARVLLAQGDAVGATALLRRALQARQTMFDPNSPLVAESEVWLARARRAAGDTSEAAQLMQRARTALSSHAMLAPYFSHLI
jgi:serine/threonine-protein kinase